MLSRWSANKHQELCCFIIRNHTDSGKEGSKGGAGRKEKGNIHFSFSDIMTEKAPKGTHSLSSCSVHGPEHTAH